MELFGIAITILATVITYQTWKNGRWMKLAHEETQELIREMHRDTAETLRRVDETQKGISETLRRMDETQKGIVGTQEGIARLIVAEGEKTRQAIKA